MAVDKIVWKIILDIAVLACVAVPLLVLLLWVEPFHRGYFENDASLKLPYKETLIHEFVLSGVGFAFILATILIIEIVRDRQGRNIGEKFLSGSVVPGWVWETYTTFGVFCFGAACQQLTSDLTKYLTGRLRPYFHEVCQPLPNPSSPLNRLGYIQEYECQGTNEKLLKDMRLSFPSAHASFSMYLATFFILYVQTKGKWRGSKLLRHGIQFSVLLAAWFVGLTRLQENHHHWSDIAFGNTVGIVYGIIVFVYVLKPKKYGLPTHTTWDEPVPNGLPRPALTR